MPMNSLIVVFFAAFAVCVLCAPTPPTPSQRFSSSSQLTLTYNGSIYPGVATAFVDFAASMARDDAMYVGTPFPLDFHMLYRGDLQRVFWTNNADECSDAVAQPQMPYEWGWLQNASYSGVVSWNGQRCDTWTAPIDYLRNFGPCNQTIVFPEGGSSNVPVGYYIESLNGVFKLSETILSWSTASIPPQVFEIPAACLPASKNAGRLGSSCGATLTSYDGVDAYSNGVDQGGYNCCGGNGEYGCDYQCVELSQRWAAIKWGTAKIWPVQFANQMCANHPSGVKKTSNPKAGDIVVFSWAGSQAGHTGIYLSSGSGVVNIMEQNASPTGKGTWQDSAVECYLTKS